MGFSNLLGLLALIGVPVIIVLYMLRPKNKPYKIPSLYLWQYAIDEIESASRINRLKRSILMFLQILIVILIALILANLFIKAEIKSKEVIVVMDCSITMQATDIKPTRMDEAKKLAVDYVNQLSKDSSITLIAMKEVPEIIINQSNNKQMVKEAIKQLESVDLLADRRIVNDTINMIKTEDSRVVYFGDRSINGGTNYQVKKTDNNILVSDVIYTKYNASNTIVALVKVHNLGNEAVRVPVSLYVDHQFFTAKEIMIAPQSEGNCFFETIPMDIRTLEAVAEVEDILEVDNKGTAMVVKDQIKKVALVSASNIFLEKILKLDDHLEVYNVEPKDIELISGYDLYIYDGVMPEVFKNDGAKLIFDYSNSDIFDALGYIQHPEFVTTGHSVVNHIEKPEFNTWVTKVYSDIEEKDIIYHSEYGPCAFTADINDQKAIVLGFDLHESDLPLSIEFPILMTNSLEYLLPGSLIKGETHYTGDDVLVTIKPQVTAAYIINPKGEKIDLDTMYKEVVFKETSKVGVYTLVEKFDEGEYRESFALNVSSYNEQSEQVMGTSEHVKIIRGTKSLRPLLTFILIGLMLVEWLIYNYKFKIRY